MRQIASLLIPTLLLLGGCHSLGKSGAAGPTAADSVDTRAQADPVNAAQDGMGHGETIGIKTVRGTLVRSKGRMGQLGGMIIPGDQLSNPGEPTWRPEVEALVGKEVEAQGEHYRYVCGPIEQCLEGGVINYLTKLAYIRAAD